MTGLLTPTCLVLNRPVVGMLSRFTASPAKRPVQTIGAELSIWATRVASYTRLTAAGPEKDRVAGVMTPIAPLVRVGAIE